MSLRQDARILKALGDEKRLMIMEMLTSGEKCASVILQNLSITQSTLSHHMKLLCDAGLVDYRKVGTWMYYTISSDCKKYMDQMVPKYLTDHSNN